LSPTAILYGANDMPQKAKSSVSASPTTIETDVDPDQPDVTESEDDLQSVDPSMLGQAVVFGTDWTAATLIDQLRRENIRLDPIFQRRDAWNAQRKSRFIESIVLGLPIPQIVLAEAKDDKGTFLVIDGKQRLLSLQQFAGIGVVPPQEPLVLKDLKFRPELNDRSYEGLKKDTKLRNHLNAFENQPIRTVVVKNWQKEDVLYLIFHRLNSESLPLSPQELRQALHPGPFLRFAADYTLAVGGIHRVLGITKPDFRMRDVELFVRYIAFQYDLENYSGNLKKFLDDECKDLNKKWVTEAPVIKGKAVQMEEAIGTVYDVFGDNAFRKWDGMKYENRFNRAVFDIMTYYFANERVRKHALLKKVKVKASFQNLSHDPAFVRSVESTTKSVEATSKRFQLWGKQLIKTLGIQIVLPQLGK
jgi:hypothetical protein